MRKSIKKLAALASAGLMAASLAFTGVPTPASADTTVNEAGKAAAAAAFDPNGTYHAYIGCQQTSSWIFRDEWTSETLGVGGTSLQEAGLDYNCGTLLQSNDNAITQVEGTVVTDAEITGNGTYTVSVTNLGGILQETQDGEMSMIYVDTDIPMSAKDAGTVNISDVKFKIDGNTQSLPAEVFYPNEYNSVTNLIRFDVVNTYQRDQGEYLDCPSIMNPYDSFEVTFTISGFAKDKPAEKASSGSGSASGSGDMSSSSSDSKDAKKSSINPVIPVVAVVCVAVIGAAVVVVTGKGKKKSDE